jgi:histidinol phosphate phosphatase hisN-like protein
MTRRPKSRLPRKLPDPARDHPPREPKGPTRRDRLKRDHVAGRSMRYGRDEVVGMMRRLASGNPAARLGLAAFDSLPVANVEAAVAAIYGWNGDGPRARIASDRTVDGFAAACERVLEVAGGGGSLTFATTRPASLLGLYRALADAADAAGGTILAGDETAVAGPAGQRIRWIDRIAVVTDRVSLLGTDSVDAAEELLFALPRPDLVVADRTFAGVAVARGLEVVAIVDLDALALAVAAWQGRAIRVVPLDDQRLPRAYLPLLELLEEIVAARTDRGDAMSWSAMLGGTAGNGHGHTAVEAAANADPEPRGAP